MSKTIAQLLLILTFIVAFFVFRNRSANETGTAAATTSASAPEYVKIDLGTWSFGDGSGLNINSKDHFRYLKSKFQYLEPIGSDLSSAIDNTAEYLKSNPNRSLLITGYYDEDESNGSILPNIGQARANWLKRFLVGRGVSGRQIQIDGADHNNWFARDTLFNGIDFSFLDFESDNNEKIEAIADRLKGKAFNLNFATDATSLPLTAVQRSDFADIIYYLDNVEDSRLDIVGHSDNVGDRDYNNNLSKERAAFIRQYLNSRGSISIDQMMVDSKGPDIPISSNETEAGRAQNRRVEITLK